MEATPHLSTPTHPQPTQKTKERPRMVCVCEALASASAEITERSANSDELMQCPSNCRSLQTAASIPARSSICSVLLLPFFHLETAKKCRSILRPVWQSYGKWKGSSGMYPGLCKYTVMIAWPRDERGFIGIGAVMRFVLPRTMASVSDAASERVSSTIGSA